MRIICGVLISLAAALGASAHGSSQEKNVGQRDSEARAAIKAATTDPSPQSAARALTPWLRDPNPSLRRESLQAVSARVYRAKYTGTAGNRAAEDAAVLDLLPTVENLRNDLDERVRADAISTWITLRMERMGTRGAFGLPEGAVEWIAGAYATERVPEVRVRLIQPFAVMDVSAAGPDNGVASRLLLRAIEDPNKEVLKLAIFGIVARNLVQAYDAVAELLKHESSRVRIVAAQVIPKMGSHGTRHIARVEAALAVETDEPTRLTLQASLQALRR